MLVNQKSIVRTLLVINNYCMSTFVFNLIMYIHEHVDIVF